MRTGVAFALTVVVIAAGINTAGCSTVPPPSATPSEQSRFELPAFPWPPPKPSGQFVLERSSFNGVQSQFDVGDRLTRALVGAGYPEYSFYRAPSGFALVARLERMREDGTGAPEELRFIQPGGEEPFSLTAYIQRLFLAPAGAYRQIVFVITDQPFTSATTSIRANEATRLLREGANRLPEAYRARAFSPAHAVTALVYEFRKGPQDRDVATLDPGRLTARTHLQRSGILPALDNLGNR